MSIVNIPVKKLVSEIYFLKNPHTYKSVQGIKSIRKDTDNLIEEWAKYLNRHFTKDDSQIARIHIKSP